MAQVDSGAIPVFYGDSPRVRRISVDRPWAWLSAGWRDMMAAPGVSLTYGLLILAITYLLLVVLWQFESFWLVLPMTAGFFFLAPLLAAGLYETSRRLQAGEPVSLAAAFAGFKRNPTQLSYMGVLLGLFHLGWIRIALLIFALFFGLGFTPTWETIVAKLAAASAIPFWAVGTAVGAVFAALVFAISAVSIPMLVDRDTNMFVAVATSFTAVRLNWPAMTLWAGLIVAFTVFGIIPGFLGLAVTMPLIGHATWHAYKDLVD
ncbi:MAG: DUF2189 domain-containing protein [Elioraea sp.]|nr:DUF2189 domain-containing protein [Elioraea sp.]